MGSFAPDSAQLRRPRWRTTPSPSPRTRCFAKHHDALSRQNHIDHDIAMTDHHHASDHDRHCWLLATYLCHLCMPWLPTVRRTHVIPCPSDACPPRRGAGAGVHAVRRRRGHPRPSPVGIDRRSAPSSFRWSAASRPPCAESREQPAPPLVRRPGADKRGGFLVAARHDVP